MWRSNWHILITLITNSSNDPCVETKKNLDCSVETKQLWNYSNLTSFFWLEIFIFEPGIIWFVLHNIEQSLDRQRLQTFADLAEGYSIHQRDYLTGCGGRRGDLASQDQDCHQKYGVVCSGVTCEADTGNLTTASCYLSPGKEQFVYRVEYRFQGFECILFSEWNRDVLMTIICQCLLGHGLSHLLGSTGGLWTL